MGFFSGVFDSDKLADAINTTKNATKNITGKVAGSFAESAGEMKKFSEKTKKMKQSVEGAIMRYGVTYKGGLAKSSKAAVRRNWIEYYGGVLLFKTNHRHK